MTKELDLSSSNCKMLVMQTSSEILFWLYHAYSCSAHEADHEYHPPGLRKPSFTEKTSKYWKGAKNDFFRPFFENPRCFMSFYPRDSSLVSFNSPFETDLSLVIFKSRERKLKVWRGQKLLSFWAQTLRSQTYLVCQLSS